MAQQESTWPVSTSEERMVWLSGKPQAWPLRGPGYCAKTLPTQRPERIGQVPLKDILEKISPSQGAAEFGKGQSEQETQKDLGVRGSVAQPRISTVASDLSRESSLSSNDLPAMSLPQSRTRGQREQAAVHGRPESGRLGTCGQLFATPHPPPPCLQGFLALSRPRLQSYVTGWSSISETSTTVCILALLGWACCRHVHRANS